MSTQQLHHAWDNILKRLITAQPQHFVSWLLEGARFKGFKPTTFLKKEIEADIIMEVELDGEEILLHIEFQSSKHKRMAQRLLEYNVSATREHGRRVLSCVIYLRAVEDENLAVSPLEWKLPNGKVILSFLFLVVKLWEIPAEEFIKMGFPGLLPLLPLTQGGKQHQVIDQMADSLYAARAFDLLAMGKILAGLVLSDEADEEWLQRRFAMYHDIVEKSWVYQEILQEGFTKGKKEGADQERRKSLENARATLVGIVQMRFPSMTELAQKQACKVTDLEALRKLTIQVSVVQNEQEVRIVLLKADEVVN